MEKAERTDSSFSYYFGGGRCLSMVKPKQKVDQPEMELGTDTWTSIIAQLKRQQQEERLKLIKRGKEATLEGERKDGLEWQRGKSLGG